MIKVLNTFILSMSIVLIFGQNSGSEIKVNNFDKRSRDMLELRQFIIPCPETTICDHIIKKYTGLTAQQYCNKFQSEYFNFVYRENIEQRSMEYVDMNLASVLYNKDFPMILINGDPIFTKTYYFNESILNPEFRTEVSKAEKLKGHHFKKAIYQDGYLKKLDYCDFSVINIEL